MRSVVLARRYAKALFELAIEKKLLDQVAKEVLAFDLLLKDDGTFRHFFISPENSVALKSEAIEKSLDKKCSDLFKRFLLILIEKRRQNIFEEIAIEFGRIYDMHSNTVRGYAITASSIGNAELQNLQKALSKQFNATFELQNKIDANILGGLILQIGGKVYDNSLRNHLNQLEKRLLAQA